MIESWTEEGYDSGNKSEAVRINRTNDNGENRKNVVKKRIQRKTGTQTVYRKHELSRGDSDTTNGTNSEEEEIINNSLRKNKLRRIENN